MADKIYFSAKTQYENLGDGVIGCQLLNLMRRRGDLVVDNRDAPKWYDAVLGIDINESVRDLKIGFKRRLVLDAFRRLRSSSNTYLVLKPGHIFGGGGLLREIGYTGFMLLLFLLRVRIVRYGCSLGPFNKVGKIFEPIKAACSWDYTARDLLSIEYSKSIGIPKVKYCPDMAFCLDYGNSKQAKKYWFGISFRTGTTSENEGGYTDNLERHLLGSSWIQQASDNLLFVSQVKRDDQYLMGLRDRLKSAGDIICYEESCDSKNKIFLTYEDVDVVLSNRLHVLLFAASRGAIPVAVVEKEKHKKIVGIFRHIGLEELIFDISGNLLLDAKLDEVKERAKYYRSKVASAFSEQRELLLEVLY